MEKEKGLEERTDKKKEVEVKNVGSLFSIFRSVGRTNVALFNKFNWNLLEGGGWWKKETRVNDCSRKIQILTPMVILDWHLQHEE